MLLHMFHGGKNCLDLPPEVLSPQAPTEGRTRYFLFIQLYQFSNPTLQVSSQDLFSKLTLSES